MKWWVALLIYLTGVAVLATWMWRESLNNTWEALWWSFVIGLLWPFIVAGKIWWMLFGDVR